jgi:hypothetical protein
MQTIKHRQDAGGLMQATWGFVLCVMVVLGICGTIYKLLSPSGWIAALMGRGFSGGVAAIGLMIVFGVVGWVARSWTSTRQQSGAADITVYVFAAAGLLYSFQLWSKGAF